MMGLIGKRTGQLKRLLAADSSGIAITEFGFVAPVFCMMLMGTFDMGYSYYTQSVLQGAVQEGARRASLENMLWSDIEDRVKEQILTVLPSSDPDTEISFSLEEKSYENYEDVALPEVFEDKERDFTLNGTYDGPEPFTDVDGDGRWDPGEDFVDTAPFNLAYDGGEPFSDWNHNGVRDNNEPFTDKPRGHRNNVYDSDECFIDQNSNDTWDADIGVSGRRGAQDVVWIKASVTFKRIFPLWKFLGQPQEMTLTAQSFLRNQPFDARPGRSDVRICPGVT